MKPSKPQFNPEQKESISSAKGGLLEQVNDKMRWNSDAAHKKHGHETARKLISPAEDHNFLERKTFKNSQVSIATLIKRQKKAGGTLDQGVSGDALARVRSGDPARYAVQPIPLPKED